MSYTSFSYSGLSVKAHLNAKSLASGKRNTQPGGDASLYADILTASFTVKNTGAYDGNEVAQLYIVRNFPLCFAMYYLLIRRYNVGFPQFGQGAPSSTQRIRTSVHQKRTKCQIFYWSSREGYFHLVSGKSPRPLHEAVWT